MVNRGDRVCFPGEPLVHHVVPGYQLQRHNPAKPFVARPEDGRRTPHADQAVQQVAAYPGTRGKPGQYAP
jgi:hypothetical protein